MTNPFDALAVARDLLRQDECELLFDQIRAEVKRVSEQYGLNLPDDAVGYLDGLRFVMDLLDGRIGELRDRWG